MAGKAEAPTFHRNALQQFADERFFFFQFYDRCIDFRATEFIYRDHLQDLPLAGRMRTGNQEINPFSTL